MSALALALAFLLVLANGVFVALEFAVVGSSRDRLESLRDQGNRRAGRALAATANLSMFLAASQLGITMASLGIGFLAEPVLEHQLASLFGGLLPSGVVTTLSVVLALGVVAFVHMVLGEIVPKNLAIAAPERVLLALAGTGVAFVRVVRPVVRVLVAAAQAGVRAFGVEPRDELSAARTTDELAVLVEESHDEGLIGTFARDLLAGVLDFEDRTAGELMVPRDRLVTVPRAATVAEAEAVMVESGHSRLPVLDVAGDADTVLGFVHSKDLLGTGHGDRDRLLPFRLVRRMLVVRTDASADQILAGMRRARVHVALVRDDANRTAGIVTLEDLLEELVGDIVDESDREAGRDGH